ncbi:MAG TPA: type II toxin-antitoxin system death-on-curing family toxin [Allosphingosinicella sp.]
MARPVNAWLYGEKDAVVLAVTLLMGLARNHPILQGNKRTAFAAADYFLFLNGYELAIEDSIEFADLIVDVIGGHVAEQRLVTLISDHLIRV